MEEYIISMDRDSAIFTYRRALGFYAFLVAALFSIAVASDFQRLTEISTPLTGRQSSKIEMIDSRQTYQLPQLVDIHSSSDVLLEATEAALRLPIVDVLRDGRSDIIRNAPQLKRANECGLPSMVVSHAHTGTTGIPKKAVAGVSVPPCSLVVNDISSPFYNELRRWATSIYLVGNESSQRLWDQAQRKMLELVSDAGTGRVGPKARPFILVSPEPALLGETRPAVVAVPEVGVRRGLGKNGPALMTVSNGYVFDRTTAVDGAWVLVETAQGNGYVPRYALLIVEK